MSRTLRCPSDARPPAASANIAIGCAFVEQPELSLGILAIGRIHEDPATEQRSVEVCHQGADISGTVAPLRLSGVAPAASARWTNDRSTPRSPNRAPQPGSGNADVAVAQEELADRRIEREPEAPRGPWCRRASSTTHRGRSRRPTAGCPGCRQSSRVPRSPSETFRWIGEDGPDRDVDVDVGRSVQGDRRAARIRPAGTSPESG